jgi:hypothetical protein
MMKNQRFILSVLGLFAFCASVVAQETLKVTLSSDQKEWSGEVGMFCKIWVQLTESDDADNPKLSISVQNLNTVHAIALFDKAYTTKMLKKQSPKLKFDKSVFNRTIQPCKHLRQPVWLGPSQRKTHVMDVTGTSLTVELPFWMARYKKGFFSKGWQLWQESPIILEITVEANKPDPEYPSVNSAVRDFIKELAAKPICPNAKHNPRKSTQVQQLEEKRSKLLKRIGDICKKHQWKETNKNYQQYKRLRENLENMDFADYEKDCGRHRPGPGPEDHSCKYCKSSLSDIQSKMLSLYQKKTRGKLSEGDASDARLMWSCCTAKKNAKRWNNGGNDKRNITEYYQEIMK